MEAALAPGRGGRRHGLGRARVDRVGDELTRDCGEAGQHGRVLASAANTYWTAALQGVQDAAKKQGNVKLTVFDAQFTTNKQINQLRDALVSKKYDAWFIGPNDGGPLTPTIKLGVKQGVKVACTLVPCGPNIRNPKTQIPGVVAQIGISFFANGQGLGLLTVKACKGVDPCKVVWLPGLPSLPLEKARTDGLYSVIKPHKNIQVVAVQAGGYLAAPAPRPPRTSSRRTPM